MVRQFHGPFPLFCVFNRFFIISISLYSNLHGLVLFSGSANFTFDYYCVVLSSFPTINSSNSAFIVYFSPEGSIYSYAATCERYLITYCSLYSGFLFFVSQHLWCVAHEFKSFTAENEFSVLLCAVPIVSHLFYHIRICGANHFKVYFYL